MPPAPRRRVGGVSSPRVRPPSRRHRFDPVPPESVRAGGETAPVEYPWEQGRRMQRCGRACSPFPAGAGRGVTRMHNSLQISLPVGALCRRTGARLRRGGRRCAAAQREGWQRPETGGRSRGQGRLDAHQPGPAQAGLLRRCSSPPLRLEPGAAGFNRARSRWSRWARTTGTGP